MPESAAAVVKKLIGAIPNVQIAGLPLQIQSSRSNFLGGRKRFAQLAVRRFQIMRGSAAPIVLITSETAFINAILAGQYFKKRQTIVQFVVAQWLPLEIVIQSVFVITKVAMAIAPTAAHRLIKQFIPTRNSPEIPGLF